MPLLAGQRDGFQNRQRSQTQEASFPFSKSEADRHNYRRPEDAVKQGPSGAVLAPFYLQLLCAVSHDSSVWDSDLAGTLGPPGGGGGVVGPTKKNEKREEKKKKSIFIIFFNFSRAL